MSGLQDLRPSHLGTWGEFHDVRISFLL
jgi:hypothetical protein